MKKLLPMLFGLGFLFTHCTSSPKTEQQANSEIVPATKDTLLGPSGADQAKFRIADGVAIYQYPNFTLLVEYTELEDGTAGEAIRMVRPSSADTTLVMLQGFHFFGGVAGNLLFVDEGTYELGRTMHVLDLQSGREIGQFRFDDEQMAIEGNQIRYFVLLSDALAKALTPKPDCPQEQEILKAGMGIGYVQQYIFDIKTGRSTATGFYKCRALS